MVDSMSPDVRPSALTIGVSNGIFRGESLQFVLKLAAYLEMDWVELKTELLAEGLPACVSLLNSRDHGRDLRLSVHASYQRIDLCALGSEQRAIHERDIDFAQAIGSDRVVFHAGYARDLEPRAALERVAAALHHYLEYSRGSGLRILLENASPKRGKLCSDPRQLVAVLQGLPDPRLGATLDIVNFMGARGEKHKEAYKSLLRWVRHIHVNSTPVHLGELKMKKYVKYFLEKLRLKKHLRQRSGQERIPVILEGKTSLAREMRFYHALRRKLE